MGDAYLESLDFTQLGYGTITREMLERTVPPVERFMMSHTKQELFEGAVTRRILLFPVATPRDIVHNPQLQARNFWQEVIGGGSGKTLKYPGGFAVVNGQRLQIRRAAPRVGEHNAEVYGAELGLNESEIAQLQADGVI